MHFRPFIPIVQVSIQTLVVFALLPSRQPLNGAKGYGGVRNHNVQHINPPSVKKAVNWGRRGFGDTEILLNPGVSVRQQKV